MKKKNRERRDAPAAGGAMFYVVGGAVDPERPDVRPFPLLMRGPDESEWAHAMRVARAVRNAVAAGGTHLLVPREQADWLGEHPLVVEYFAARHEVVEASAKTGVLFKLNRAMV